MFLFPHTPHIQSLYLPIKRPEDIPWPLQTNDIEKSIQIIEEQRKRSKRWFLTKKKRQLYKDILEGMERIEAELWERKRHLAQLTPCLLSQTPPTSKTVTVGSDKFSMNYSEELG